MSHSKKNTAKLLTLAITITLLSGLPLMAQDADYKSSDTDARPPIVNEPTEASLISSEPWLGKPVTLAAADLTPGGSAWFLYSLVPNQPVQIDPYRTVYVDLESYVAIGAFKVEEDGCLVVTGTLPDLPQLADFEIAVQVASVPAEGGLELTNGLIWGLLF